MSIVAICLAVFAGLVLNLVVTARSGATRSIGEEHEPAIVAAQQVQTSLAEANAAAANAFLAGGGEDPLQRQRYEASLAAAASALTDVSASVDEDSEAKDTVTSVSQSLVGYSGLVESARASNRQNFPIGAAYLTAASNVLESEIYPATDELANGRAEQYRSSYNNQVGLVGVVSLVLLFGALLGLLVYLVGVHQEIAKRFRRMFNGPIVVGFLLAGVVLLWSVVGVLGQVGGLQTARQEGYEDVRTLINLRGLGFRAKAEESQFLIARGGIPLEGFVVEADKVTAELDRLVTEPEGSGLTSAEVSELNDSWTTYGSLRANVGDLASAGERDAAVALALGESSQAFDQFDADVDRLLTSNQGTFAAEMDSAQASLAYLGLVGPLLLLLGAGAVFFGFQQRIREYQ